MISKDEQERREREHQLRGKRNKYTANDLRYIIRMNMQQIRSDIKEYFITLSDDEFVNEKAVELIEKINQYEKAFKYPDEQ